MKNFKAALERSVSIKKSEPAKKTGLDRSMSTRQPSRVLSSIPVARSLSLGRSKGRDVVLGLIYQIRC